jgi:hypothetical protein
MARPHAPERASVPPDTHRSVQISKSTVFNREMQLGSRISLEKN